MNTSKKVKGKRDRKTFFITYNLLFFYLALANNKTAGDDIYVQS
jgi:hypothetical protein